MPITQSTIRVIRVLRESGLNFSDDLKTLKMSITNGMPIDMMTPSARVSTPKNSKLSVGIIAANCVPPIVRAAIPNAISTSNTMTKAKAKATTIGIATTPNAITITFIMKLKTLTTPLAKRLNNEPSLACSM